MNRYLLLCCALIVSTQAQSHNCDKSDRCQSIKDQIQKIESKMRQGYSAAQGIRYDERLRTLRQKRRKACR